MYGRRVSFGFLLVQKQSSIEDSSPIRPSRRTFLPAIPWVCITFNPSMKSSKRYTLLGTHSMRGVSYKNSSSSNFSFMARNVSSTAWTPTEEIVDDPAEIEPTLSNAPPLDDVALDDELELEELLQLDEGLPRSRLNDPALTLLPPLPKSNVRPPLDLPLQTSPTCQHASPAGQPFPDGQAEPQSALA